MADAAPAFGRFERFLSVWVAVAIVVGIVVGRMIPAIPDYLARFTVAEVSLPVALLIWMMILPMMLRVDFSAVRGTAREPAGLVITSVANWLVKPFSMFVVAWLFFFVVYSRVLDDETARGYLAGAVLLGAAPCTAMVFVWSHLVRGDATYTLVQVAFNDLIMVVAFAPIVMFLLRVSDLEVAWSTMIASVVLYIVVPLIIAMVIRRYTTMRRGDGYFASVTLARVSKLTPPGLLLMLVVLFSFQGETILDNPLHIVLIAVPLVVQTIFIYAVTQMTMTACRIRPAIAAPGALVAASNFFELAVATAVTLFGLTSPAVLATVVGVLVEVPLMLLLVDHANRRRREDLSGRAPAGVA